jgi:hypothetical protein
MTSAATKLTGSLKYTCRERKDFKSVNMNDLL